MEDGNLDWGIGVTAICGIISGVLVWVELGNILYSLIITILLVVGGCVFGAYYTRHMIDNFKITAISLNVGFILGEVAISIFLIYPHIGRTFPPFANMLVIGGIIAAVIVGFFSMIVTYVASTIFQLEDKGQEMKDDHSENVLEEKLSEKKNKSSKKSNSKMHNKKKDESSKKGIPMRYPKNKDIPKRMPKKKN